MRDGGKIEVLVLSSLLRNSDDKSDSNGRENNSTWIVLRQPIKRIFFVFSQKLFSYSYSKRAIIIDSKKIYPVVVAQIRAGCTEREAKQKLHSYQSISQKVNSHKDTLKNKKFNRLGDNQKLNI